MRNRLAVERVLQQTVASLEGIERPALLQIIQVLHQAQQEVARDLTAWLRNHPGGDTFTAQRYRNALAVLDTAIRRGGDLEGTVGHALKATAKHLGPLSIANIKREWAAFSHIFEGTVQPLPLDEAVILARGNKLLWPKFERSAAKYAGQIGERAKLELAVSRARGETIDELTNRLYKRMPAVFRGERSDAERLAITETHNSYRQFHHEAIIDARAEDDHLMERWEGSHDGRRCIICAMMDGQTVEPGEPFITPYGDRIYEGEGVHPRDRCGRVAWRDTWPTYANRTSEETVTRAREAA